MTEIEDAGLLVDGPGDGWEARDDARLERYQQALLGHTAATWDAIEQAQGDLLRLLVGRVPATVGAEVILGLAVLLRDDPAGEETGRRLLATVMDDLAAGYGWTLLVALADGFANAERRRFDERPGVVRAELGRALRRLAALELPEADRAALERVRGMAGEAG